MPGYALQINTTVDTATPALAAARAYMAPVNINRIVGRSAVNTYRAHLFGLNATRPNALGGPRTNFYAGAARATHFDILNDDTVVISINQVGMALRFYGGTVKPGKGISSVTGKPTKFLTIPARAEAHGKRAGEFNDLVVLWGKNGPYALARAPQTRISVKRDREKGTVNVRRLGAAGGEVLFWLVKQATYTADPTVLPHDAQVTGNINRDLQSQLAVDLARAGGQS